MTSVEINCKNSINHNKSKNDLHPVLDSFDSVKCMYLNATSLDNKLDEFKAVFDTYHPGIIAVNETLFRSKSIFNISGYHVYRSDRNDGRVGGGVCLFIENQLIDSQYQIQLIRLSLIIQGLISV